MKAVNSSSSPLFHQTISQIHSLLPRESALSENWSTLPVQSDSSIPSTNIKSSSPVSLTPSSVNTDFSDNDFHPIDLSCSHKYFPSTPPLSNIKSEPIDSTDLSSLMIKSETTSMIIPSQNRILLDRDKPLKKRAKFTIAHLLSDSCPMTQKEIHSNRKKHSIQSIFNKKMKTKHFSDQYLHRIISPRKQVKNDITKCRRFSLSRMPKENILSFIFDSFKDLINSQIKQIDDEREKFSPADPLKQFADIACKLGTREQHSIFNHQDRLTGRTYQHWLKQCQDLFKQIYQKYQQKKLPKRLNFKSKSKYQRRHLLHLPKSISNLLKVRKNFLFSPTTTTTKTITNHSDCFTLSTSDNSEKNPSMICSHLKANEIRSNLEILLPNNDLIYEGILQCVDQHDDLFLIRLNHERQSYLIPLHDLCRLACRKQIPTSFQMLREGSRVCALWSESLRGLHPASVKKMPTDTNESSMIELLFDDFDTGLIKLNEIRLLPNDFQIKGVNLDEWRVSSSQIPTSISDCSRRRLSSTTKLSSTSIQKNNSNKKSSSTSKLIDIIPSWTLNTRTSTIFSDDTNEIIHVGDCVVLHGADKSLSYIGKVLKFYRNRSTDQELVRLQWYYSPEEIPKGDHRNNLPGALFESTHIDDNPIATVRFKGIIYSSYDEYVKKTNFGNEREKNDFYLVGHYNPTTGELKRFDTNKSKKRRNY